MNAAIEKICDMYYREEERHFREWIEDEEKKDKTKFVNKLKDHILYSIMTLILKGDENAVKDWVEKYWDENREDDEEDERVFGCDACRVMFDDGKDYCYCCHFDFSCYNMSEEEESDDE